MKISVMSLFRDSEECIHRTLKQFESMKDIDNVEFEFFFYENDSLDNTRKILQNWCDLNNGKITYEDQGCPAFGSTVNFERFLLLSYYRNKLKNFTEENTDSDYTIILDSDIVFSNGCLEKLIKYKDYNNCSMMTGNPRQSIPSQVFSKCITSYYDTAAFTNRLGASGQLWCDCPSILDYDLESWKKGLPIKVNSAFGGIAILKTKYLKQTYWSSHGQSEHVEFCYRLHEFGDIYSLPSARCFITDAVVPQVVLKSTRMKQYQMKKTYEKYKEQINQYSTGDV